MAKSNQADPGPACDRFQQFDDPYTAQSSRTGPVLDVGDAPFPSDLPFTSRSIASQQHFTQSTSSQHRFTHSSVSQQHSYPDVWSGGSFGLTVGEPSVLPQQPPAYAPTGFGDVTTAAMSALGESAAFSPTGRLSNMASLAPGNTYIEGDGSYPASSVASDSPTFLSYSSGSAEGWSTSPSEAQSRRPSIPELVPTASPTELQHFGPARIGSSSEAGTTTVSFSCIQEVTFMTNSIATPGLR